MTTVSNPALATFLAQWRDELTLAQVLIRRTAAGYELRHVADREAAPPAQIALTGPMPPRVCGHENRHPF